ncbi:hypothetical protein DOY81_002807, partial [Sarcophaga bullata]
MEGGYVNEEDSDAIIGVESPVNHTNSLQSPQAPPPPQPPLLLSTQPSLQVHETQSQSPSPLPRPSPSLSAQQQSPSSLEVNEAADLVTPIKLPLFPGESEPLAPAYETTVKPLKTKETNLKQKLRDFNWHRDTRKIREKFYFEYHSKEKFMG